MKAKTKTAWPALGLALAGLTAGAAEAANPAQLNIDVSITQNLSVSVDNAGTSTHTVAWNTGNPNEKLVSAATATVRNDSGAQTERWELKTNANSIPTSGTDVWSVSTDSSAVGAEQFALQAVFGSSMTAAGGCLSGASADWDQDYAGEVTTASQIYTSSLFAASNLNNDGTPNPDDAGTGRMNANSRRALCWRVITPASTVASATQNIQLIITALAP